MYADDTHLTFASNNVAHLDHVEEHMNDDLTKITEWLTASKLTLHTETYDDHWKASALRPLGLLFLEIFKFLYYANEDSDDVAGGSIKTV